MKFTGINFDHMHMGDLLRQVHEHPDGEIAGVCHESVERMQSTIDKFAIPPDRVFTDVEACLAATRPDVVLLCPSTARHAEYVERVAPHGAHILVEKPFAATLEEADRMIAAMAGTGKQLMINWPLRWYPCHITAKRLIDEGLIGEMQQVHYYDGNRGPLRHGADKIETEPGKKSESWFYQKSQGGGSLLDYLGYGVTLGTWYMDGKSPIEVTAAVDQPPGLEVDEHSITIARYDTGLSKFETRWGAFTDPWVNQPQPKCGFVLVGSKGTISSYDYEPKVRVQTEDCPEGRDIPADKPVPADPITYFIDRIRTNTPADGPLSPEICRIGQQIVDAATRSAKEKRTVAL